MTLKEFFGKDRFAADAGCEIVEASEGHAIVRMTVEERHLNAGGVCQGGAIFTLADLANAVCTNSHGQLSFSINSNIYIMRSAKVGDVLTAEGVEENHHKLPFVDVKVRNQDGDLIAIFTGQAYRKNIELPID